MASAPAGVLAASLRRSSSDNGRRPPLGAICLGMHDDIKLNAFAKFRCAARGACTTLPHACTAALLAAAHLLLWRWRSVLHPPP